MPAPTKSGLPRTPSPHGRLGQATLAPQPSVHQRRQAAKYADPHKAVIHVQYVPHQGWRVLKPDAPRVPYSVVQAHFAERAAHEKAKGWDGKAWDVDEDLYQYIRDPDSNMYFKVPYDLGAASEALGQRQAYEKAHPYDPRSLLQRLFQDGGGYFVAANTVVKWATLGTVIVYGIVGAAIVLTSATTLAVLGSIASSINDFVMLSEITITGYFETIATQIATVLRLGPLARILLSAPIIRAFFNAETRSGGSDADAALIRAGSGMNPNILSGHGGISPPYPTFTVPAGTSVTTFVAHGDFLEDDIANVVETGGDLAPYASRLRGMHTYPSGSTMPNYSLYPESAGGPINIMDHPTLGPPTTVTVKTSLDKLLSPGMGNVKWVACCEILDK